MRMRCRFGSNRRLVATIEWLRLWPNDGARPQTEQTLDTSRSMLDLRRARKRELSATTHRMTRISRAMADDETTTATTIAGAVTIGDDVVAQIVGLTVLECYGVVGMASRRLVHGVARLLGRDALTQGIDVARDPSGRLAIDLYVVMEHGLNLAEVAENVRARVTYQVERLTGLPVGSLQIHIQDVRRAR